jgi:DNA-directed RNA polymerase specialized sigma24 family protein
MDDMKTLTKAQRVAVIRCLVEGCSVRSTARITGIAINTVQKLTRRWAKPPWPTKTTSFVG